MTILKSVAPILLASDVSRAAAFWEALGFTTDFLHGQPIFYGAVSRDGVVIQMRHIDEPPFAAAAARGEQLICATIEVDDVVALHAEFAARGVAFSLPLTRQSWGGTEFHISDPDGNAVSFAAYG